MYFPYFRGRQYELLALKDLALNRLISNSVVPVIEPVKLIPALNNALSAFDESELPLGLIMNPNVGDLTDEPSTISHLLLKLTSNQNIIPSLLLNESADSVMKSLRKSNIHDDDILCVLNNRDYVERYKQLFADAPRYTLCPDERSIRRAISQNKVLFENRFHKQNRNADYPEDEFFSDDHLYYADEQQYIGFGDYSIVGDDYIESGFAPYAVAIHIVYFAAGNVLRIKHFVSDSNDDISDVAGKFFEAVTKLNRWYTDEHQERQLTKGLQTLLNHFNQRTYPGLPTLKKLSIMHHLELMDKYLNGRFSE